MFAYLTISYYFTQVFRAYRNKITNYTTMKKPQFNCPDEESARIYHTTMRFWDACEQGNVSAMHREYESGADVNYRSMPRPT